MPHTSAVKINSELFDLFNDSTLALYADTDARALFAAGQSATLLPESPLLPSAGRRLVVVLDGTVSVDGAWYGPGNHFQQGDSVVTALQAPARLWMLALDATPWAAGNNMALRKATTRALIAADAAEAQATPPAGLPDPRTLCDVDHPDIRRRAARLRRASPASTAEAILRYVHAMPYRFGTWQERASDTMVRGVGMCTTKTNLQVALMRAAGLEAGFVEIPMETSVLGKLMPTGWLALQRKSVKHYFAAVKLDGVWHGADSSYDVVSYRIFLETFPWMAHRETPTLTVGSPYIPALEIQHADLFDITVRDEISEEMGKTSRFLPRHFEALNTRVDRARGVHLRWSKAAEGLASTQDEALA